MWPFFIWWTLALRVQLRRAGRARARVACSTPPPTRGADRRRWSLPPRAPPCRCTSARASAGARSRSTACRDAFDGYRIVQISDLHCGPFASGRRVARWVAAANRLEPDLVAVTGDLIASGSAFIDIVARALGGLRARDGAFAAMGNHDYFGDGEAMVSALEAAGLTVLRNRGVELRRGMPRDLPGGRRRHLDAAARSWRARWRRGRRACPRCCSRTIRRCFPKRRSRASIWCCRATRTAVRSPCRCSRAS